MLLKIIPCYYLRSVQNNDLQMDIDKNIIIYFLDDNKITKLYLTLSRRAFDLPLRFLFRILTELSNILHKPYHIRKRVK